MRSRFCNRWATKMS